MGAGQYPDHMRLQVRSLEKNTVNGQDREVFTNSQYLWCRIEINNGRRQRDYGATQTGADATIYVRNFLTGIQATDRLISIKWGDTWMIDNIRRGDNEMIADVFKFDTLQL